MMEWIKCADEQPKLPGDFDYIGRSFIVAYPGYQGELQVTNMTYQRTKVRGKRIERWEWNDRIAANAIGEPLYWMPLPAPPANND